MKVLTWNINFRTAEALEPLLGLSPLPDVITLQEVTHEHADAVSARLKDRGYDSVYSGTLKSSEKRYGNVVAARKLEEVRIPANSRFPWPQLVCHAAVEADAGSVHVVTVHVPNGSGNGWKKIDTLDALRQLVLGLKGEPLVLTGDFNEPRYAMQDGQVVTWGQEESGGRWEVWDGEWTDANGVTAEWSRWDRTVRWFFENPDESGLRNALWEADGRGAMEATHFSRGNPRWFDHVFVSEHFRVDDCTYFHAFRDDGFSDHSALLAALS